VPVTVKQRAATAAFIMNRRVFPSKYRRGAAHERTICGVARAIRLC